MSTRTIAILASDQQRTELLRSAPFNRHRLVFADGLAEFVACQADAYADLLFEPDAERIKMLGRLRPQPIFINSVIQTLGDIGPGFIRINGWPGFLEMPLLEAAAPDEISRKQAAGIFGEYIIFVQDVPGLVNPRIISMMINEAYFTLAAGTASREEIDMAMKLGTAYPSGPFEWAKKIGTGNIHSLLTELGRSDDLYIPAPGLTKT